MPTLRGYNYDHQNYALVRTHTAHGAVASAVKFAQFMSRAQVLINAISLRIASAASLVSVLITVTRGGSVNTILSITSATSAGLVTTWPVSILMTGMADAVEMTHNDKGEYTITYEYQVLANETLYQGT
jgi:hypothetical protein